MITDPAILEYAGFFTGQEKEILRELDRDTNLHVVAPNMLSGHLQGKFLEMVSTMIRPRRILEVGTYTAYGTICLASGLTDDGIIHTIESNEELLEMIATYLKKAGIEEKTKVHFGDALSIIPALEDVFDLVFLDAAKDQYSDYYDLVFDKVRPGGFILADNVLWGGKILHKKPDSDTLAIMRFNRKVMDDPRVDNLLLPVRDGIMMIRKIPAL